MLDVSIQILQYVILFVHLILVFGNRKWVNIVLLVLITNLIIIGEYILTGYLLFGDGMFKQTGTKNLLELILKAYRV